MSRVGNIVLCGFMGCGKSTVGRCLAAMTGRLFVDTDAYIEQREGRTVSELFAVYGEEGFRRRERLAAAELAARPELVIATGGGTVLDPASAAALRAGGQVVLLDTPLECIFLRLAGDTTRPLMQNGHAAAEALYRARMPAYRAAAHRVVAVTPQDTPDQVAARVLRQLTEI